MTSRFSRLRGARPARPRVVVGAMTAGAVLLSIAGVAAPGSTGPVSGPLAAVLTLAGAGPVRAPGVTITAYLPAVGAEIVHGPAAAVLALARDPRVAGLRADTGLVATSAGFSASSAGIFAGQGLGPLAGRPGAGAGVTVALVDSGVSNTVALNRASGRLIDGVDTAHLSAGGGGVLTRGQFTDGFGHGTFLATLIAGGPADGSPGSLGVAPGARIVVVKVADAQGRTSLGKVLAGLNWVATHQPIQVVALALAAPRPTDAYGADPLTAAIGYLRAAGLTVVVSAGNTPGQLGDPGFAPQALTVGAADTTVPTPTVAPFSGSGVAAGVRKPDVVATGVHVLGLLPAHSWIARNYPGALQSSGLWRGSGTSQATAVTAGVAAIYLAGHPTAGPEAVKAAIRGAAEPLAGFAAGQGLVSVPAGPGTSTGEAGFDPAAWWANAWDGGAWAAPLAAAWSAKSWSAKSWSAKSWSAKSWSAKSWSAKSWSAKSWSAKSWSGYSWGGR